MTTARLISGFLSGLLFGVGLAASGMTDTSKVIGFLDIFGSWDADLLFVMGSAVITTFVLFKVTLKRSKPLFDGLFDLPSSNLIDARLIGGATIFGIGWGLYGYCPGPAITALVYFQPATFVFVIAMVIGMVIAQRVLNAGSPLSK